MSPRELRLRKRIDDLRAELAKERRLTSHLTAKLTAKGRNGRNLRRCIWCGDGCYGRTCRECRVLETRLREYQEAA